MNIDINEKIKKERITILQNFAETHLRLHGAPPSEFLFKKDDVYGEINEEQCRLLRHYLKDDMARYGIDIEEYVKAQGEAFEKGKLSKCELKLLVDKADEMIVFLGVLGLRKQASDSKKQNQ